MWSLFFFSFSIFGRSPSCTGDRSLANGFSSHLKYHVCNRGSAIVHKFANKTVHRSAESEGLRFDSSWRLRIFSLSCAPDKTKNIFLYFFTERKTYHRSYSINKKLCLISIEPQGNGRTYVHKAFFDRMS